MKKLSYLFLCLVFSLAAFGFAEGERYKAPDILLDSKLEFDWTGWLISKMRKMLKNNGVADPFTMKMTEPLVVTDNIIESYLDEDGRNFINNLGNLLGLDILKGKTKVVIHGLEYDIKDFRVNLKAYEEERDGITIGSDFTSSKINLRADKVTLSLVVPSKDPKKNATIDITVARPVIRASGEKLINFFAKVKIQDNKDHFKFLIPDANFDNVADALLANPKGIYMNFRNIEIPDIKIRIGTKVLDLKEDKVKELLNNQQKAIKSLLLGNLAQQFRKGLGTTILKVMEKYEIPKDSWIESSLLISYFRLDRFNSDVNRNNLEIHMPGDFCAPTGYKAMKSECLKNKVSRPPASRVTEQMNDDSIDNMKSLIDNGEAHLVASISENYVNKLLYATYDAGLWETMLKENGVILGPDKMKLVMNNKSDKATLIMDMTNRLTVIEGIIIGTRTVRFPLVMQASVRIENKEGIPNLIIRIDSVDTSDATLKNGLPEFNAYSNIHKLRLKKMILKEIRKKVADLGGKDVLTLAYPEIKDLGLENVEFESDGMGRMNAMLKLREN